MRRSWKRITLWGGLGLVVLAGLMIVATTLWSALPSNPDNISDGGQGIRREYRDRRLPVRFYYPTSWAPEGIQEGVTLQPDAPAEDFITQGAWFAVLRSDDDDELPPLPPMLESVIENMGAVRASENVAVGGVSGRETVIEMDVGGTSAAPASLAAALQAVNSQRLTVVVWESDQEDDPTWVIMADARAGNYLGTLQEIRNSIQWR